MLLALAVFIQNNYNTWKMYVDKELYVKMLIKNAQYHREPLYPLSLKKIINNCEII